VGGLTGHWELLAIIGGIVMNNRLVFHICSATERKLAMPLLILCHLTDDRMLPEGYSRMENSDTCELKFCMDCKTKVENMLGDI
jgi:hypothetical protein